MNGFILQGKWISTLSSGSGKREPASLPSGAAPLRFGNALTIYAVENR
jgi:hypothetical protein